jgi:rare lipoprotein A
MQTVSKAPGRVAVLTLLVTTLVVLLLDSSSSFAARRSRARVRRQASKPSVEPGKVLVGRATWYGPGFHGRRTASGERFNRHALTLASRGLPFHTVVRVTNLKNGRSAVARVNDRGPFGHGAIVDLSEALARRVGMGGTSRVKVQVLGWRGTK